MKITIVGASGKIGRLLQPKLLEAGHQVRGIVRKEEQMEEFKRAGIEPVLCDIEKEKDISDAVGKVDVVVFAAGAGPGSGKERKWSVDRDGAIKLIEACKKNGINRYLIISAMGLDDPRGDEVFRVYLEAKLQADNAVKESGLDYVIVKPGRLTNGKRTGKVKIGKNLEYGEIPREDVAAVLFEIINKQTLSRSEIELISGNLSISEALFTVGT